MEQKCIRCDECGEDIYLDNDRYYGDTYYDIEGYIICDECILDFIKQFRKQG